VGRQHNPSAFSAAASERTHRNGIEKLAKVPEFLPDDATMIAGHGRPMRPSDIEISLRYLSELDNAVSTVINGGRSVEAALEAVVVAHGGLLRF
jgi:hypothetical protein